MNAREIVAANVRARLSFYRIPQDVVRKHLGCSMRSITRKLLAETSFTSDEVALLAELFGLDDPGPLYRVPEHFDSIVRTAAPDLVTSTFWQQRRSQPRPCDLTGPLHVSPRATAVAA